MAPEREGQEGSAPSGYPLHGNMSFSLLYPRTTTHISSSGVASFSNMSHEAHAWDEITTAHDHTSMPATALLHIVPLSQDGSHQVTNTQFRFLRLVLPDNSEFFFYMILSMCTTADQICQASVFGPWHKGSSLAPKGLRPQWRINFLVWRQDMGRDKINIPDWETLFYKDYKDTLIITAAEISYTNIPWQVFRTSPRVWITFLEIEGKDLDVCHTNNWMVRYNES